MITYSTIKAHVPYRKYEKCLYLAPTYKLRVFSSIEGSLQCPFPYILTPTIVRFARRYGAYELKQSKLNTRACDTRLCEAGLRLDVRHID